MAERRPPRSRPLRSRRRAPGGPVRGDPPGGRRRETDRLLDLALREDRWREDRTSRVLLPRPRPAIAYVIAQRAGIVSGLAASARLGPRTGLRLRPMVRDGRRVRPGLRVLELRGDARAILAVERTVLNLIMHLSGVATETGRAVAAAGGAFWIYGTRKTIPGLRGLEKAAIVHGGGRPHRADLASGVLVKSNHLAFGPVRSAVERLRRAYGTRRPIEVEVRSVPEAVAAVDAGAGALLIDNASPARAGAIVRAVRARPGGSGAWIELSGGLTPATLRGYRRVGADSASLGALTHSAPALPFHLRFARRRPGGRTDPAPSRRA